MEEKQMDAALFSEIVQLRAASTRVLKQRYAELFGEPPRPGRRDALFRRIAWRLQVLATGDLSELARQRAAEIACDADLRVLAPSNFLPAASPEAGPRSRRNPLRTATDRRLPAPGTTLTRAYQGRTVTATVLHDGFEFEGSHYASLSAVATRATGTRWNGFAFFRLKHPRGSRDGRR
jgi:hypothetical protein